VATTPGRVYLLSLWLDNTMAGTVQTFAVKWNGTTLSSMSDPPAFSWTNMQFLVEATSGSAALEFDAENDPNCFGLDDVSVTELPNLAFSAATTTLSGLKLTFPTVTGLTYQLQYTRSLTSPEWTNLGAPQTATGSSITVTDPSGVTGSAQRFYRLAMGLP